MAVKSDGKNTIPGGGTDDAGAGAPVEALGLPSVALQPLRSSASAERRAGAHWGESWLAAMGMLAPIVPVPTVVIATAIHYVVEVQRATGANDVLSNPLAPVLGPIVGVIGVLVVWALVALPWIPHTRCENANPNLYGRLHVWYRQFASKCDESVRQALKEQGGSPDEIVALNETQGAYRAFTDEFYANGNRWARQAGYLTLTRSSHRAEEGRIGYAPVEEVAAEAWDARLRLLDSKMDEKTRLELQRNLEISIWMLGPNARHYLPYDVKKRLEDEHIPQASDSREVSQEDVEGLARSFVAKAIYDINTYQDDRNDRLLDMRGHLVTAAGWVGGLSYLLVLFGTVLLPPTPAAQAAWPGLMLGAGALYLVGAACGLMYRLYVESRSRFAVEDYGLSMMRIVTAPVLSGLAGVVGAALMAVVLAKPTPLSEVFNVATQPYGLLYAAVFGLTPNALINYLQRQAKTYIAEIESIKAPAAASSGEPSKD